MKHKVAISSVILLIIAWFVMDDLIEGEWEEYEGKFENLETFWDENLWPPDWSILEAQTYPVCEENWEFKCSKAYMGMMETIKIAFVATALGFIGALLLSGMAARNLTPAYIYLPTRIFLSATRSLPSIIWAILFVIIFGFGPFAGVLAMTFYTIGYLGKLQYESMEGLENSPLEAGRAMGLTTPEIYLGIVIPESSNNLISQLLFMFEYNVRHGTVLGLVGAGGIGYYINTSLKLLKYDRVFAYLIIIFIVVVIIDLLSMALRSFVNEEGDVKRPSWLTVLLPASKATSLHHSSFEEE